MLAGLAAMVGPVVGGQLAKVTCWRGTFLVLAGVGVALSAALLGLVGLGLVRGAVSVPEAVPGTVEGRAAA